MGRPFAILGVVEVVLALAEREDTAQDEAAPDEYADSTKSPEERRRRDRSDDGAAGDPEQLLPGLRPQRLTVHRHPPFDVYCLALDTAETTLSRSTVTLQNVNSQYTSPACPTGTPPALAALDVHEEPFSDLDGNVQGYSKPGRVLAISPVAAHPERTLLHELRHMVLGHLDTRQDVPRPIMEVEAESVAYLGADALRLGGADKSRGTIDAPAADA